MQKKHIKLLDYFFVLRPTLFYPVWTVSLAGYWASIRYGKKPTDFDRIFFIGQHDVTYIILIGLFTLVMGASFLINQIEDAETDRLNDKLYLIANGDVTTKLAYIETAVLLVLPFILLAIFSQELLIIAILSFFVTGWCYSCKPLLLKNRPYGGLFANILGYYLVFSFGWMIANQDGVQMILHATPYVFGILSVYFFTTIPDIEGDSAVNKITMAVKYGSYPMIIAGLVSNAIAVIFSLLLKDYVILIATLTVLPFFIQTAIRKSVNDVLRTNKFATLFLSLIISYRFPGYLILMVVVFFFTRWYYRKRFNITYPSFG